MKELLMLILASIIIFKLQPTLKINIHLFHFVARIFNDDYNAGSRRSRKKRIFEIQSCFSFCAVEFIHHSGAGEDSRINKRITR